jgi:hypothetical protein
MTVGPSGEVANVGDDVRACRGIRVNGLVGTKGKVIVQRTPIGVDGIGGKAEGALDGEPGAR